MRSSAASATTAVATATAFVAALVVTSPAQAVTTLVRGVMGGGAIGASATTHSIRSTAGQPVVGSVASTTHAVLSGFWVPAPTTTAVDTAELPHAWRLYPAMPNPFGDFTTLRFDVPRLVAATTGGATTGGPPAAAPAVAATETHLRVRLYDVGGRLVRTLSDGPAGAGRHTIQWDGRDQSGNEVGPGIYFCVLAAPGKTFTQKLLRIR